MSDYLLRLTERPTATKLIKRLGLPTPQTLARAAEPYAERLLDGHRLLIGAGAHASALRKVETTLQAAAAEFARADVPQPDEDERFDGLVFDATGMTDVAELKSLYVFFHPLVRQLARDARVVVLTSAPASAQTVAAAAAARAVEGFVRSLAKEIGRKGAIANMLYIEPGAEKRIAGPLRFLLSDYATFVDGQAITVTNTGRAPRAIPVTQPLEDKVALVTGAARGIGAATAQRLAAEGAHVVCLDVPSSAEPLDAMVERIGGTALALDITDADAPQEIVTFLQREYGGIDIVVHNAGITRDKTLGKMPEHHWDMVLAINLQAIVAIDAAMVEEKLINDHGRVICLCSIGGIAGNAGQTNYGATKAGLIGFVERRGSSQRSRGVCVNAVAPGFIETQMTAAMPFTLREAGRRLSSLSQGGQPRDVAELITFLATPGAAGISGNVIRVCGQNLMGA